MSRSASAVFLLVAGLLRAPHLFAAVAAQAVPDGGVQPQALVDAQGTLHLIYLTGPANTSDIVYRHQAKGEAALSAPLRVNRAGTAMAIGSVRGARLAIGKNGRAHVSWNGSATAPKGADGSAPMLYARLTDDGSGFEPERNLIGKASGIDGGGAIAADGKGRVWVAWHAMAGARDEAGRAVYVAASSDDGATFAPEVKAAPQQPTGACGCCSMAASVDGDGHLWLLYRAATGGSDRGMVLVGSRDAGKTFAGDEIDSWTLNACPMSTCVLAASQGSTVAAWQRQDQIFTALIDPKTAKLGTPLAMPGAAKGRKHPAVAVNARGEMLVVWTEGTGWNQGGKLAWQLYDGQGKPIGETAKRDGVPVWGTPAVIARGDDFTVFY